MKVGVSSSLVKLKREIHLPPGWSLTDLADWKVSAQLQNLLISNLCTHFYPVMKEWTTSTPTHLPCAGWIVVKQKTISIFSSSVTTTKMLQMLSYNVSSPMIVNWQLPNPSLSSLNLMAALRLLWSVFSQLYLSWYGIEDFRKRTQIRSWWDLNLSGLLSLEENQDIIKLEKQGTLWWILLKTSSNCWLILVEIKIWKKNWQTWTGLDNTRSGTS